MRNCSDEFLSAEYIQQFYVHILAGPKLVKKQDEKQARASAMKLLEHVGLLHREGIGTVLKMYDKPLWE